jgi:hypothetical protein
MRSQKGEVAHAAPSSSGQVDRTKYIRTGLPFFDWTGRLVHTSQGDPVSTTVTACAEIGSD